MGQGWSKASVPSSSDMGRLVSFAGERLVAALPFSSPLSRLEGLLSDKRRLPQRDDVLETTRSCFLAGQLASALPVLVRSYQSSLIMQVIRQVLNGDLCSQKESLELLRRPCPKSGSTVLHLIAQHTTLRLSRHDPQLFVDLLDFLQDGRENLDHLMVPNGQNQHPLYLAMRHKTKSDSSALELMRRVSPEILWAEVTGWKDQMSTAVHAACSNPNYDEDEREEIISRVPTGVLATTTGPHGRTPVLQAAASRASCWVGTLLDCLPQEALGVCDDNNCSLVHLMTFLSQPDQNRIMDLVPNILQLASQVAWVEANCMRCRGNAAVMHMVRCGGSIMLKLVHVTSDDSLFACEAMIGEFARTKCSLLHIAAGRADVELCHAIFGRVTEQYRYALVEQDCFGLTPFHALFQVPGHNCSPAYKYGRPSLYTCTSRIVAIASRFLEVLTDEEIQVSDKSGMSVLEQLLLMMSRANGTNIDTGLFDICEELLERTPRHLLPGSRRLLGYTFKISRYSSLQCDRQLHFVASVLSQANYDEVFQDRSLYMDVMRNYPNEAAARLILEVTPPDTFKQPGNHISTVFCMLLREAVGRQELQGMVGILLEYHSASLLLTGGGGPAPIAVAIMAGNIAAVASMLEACPGARTAHLQIGDNNMTALELAERGNQSEIARLLQPMAKNAAIS